MKKQLEQKHVYCQIKPLMAPIISVICNREGIVSSFFFFFLNASQLLKHTVCVSYIRANLSHFFKKPKYKTFCHFFFCSIGLTYSTLTLFGTVLVLLLAVHLNKWKLDKKLGCALMVVYLLFVVLSSLYELNVLGSNHLPMCLDSLW